MCVVFACHDKYSKTCYVCGSGIGHRLLCLTKSLINASVFYYINSNIAARYYILPLISSIIECSHSHNKISKQNCHFVCWRDMHSVFKQRIISWNINYTIILSNVLHMHIEMTMGKIKCIYLTCSSNWILFQNWKTITFLHCYFWLYFLIKIKCTRRFEFNY